MSLPLLVILGQAVLSQAAAPRPLEFNRDVRPILSEHCFRCHGPDARARQADLRLDERAAALVEREGVRPIVPNRPELSEVVRRIESPAVDVRMPPPSSGLRLTADQVAVLRRWIADGAQYQQHWSLVPPAVARWPATRNNGWPTTAIDGFVLAELEKRRLMPTAEADKTTLIRRVSLDITGLPPSPEVVAAFLEDEGPDAYQRVVERLLASPRYGEHWATDWLDAARYADTNGYFSDHQRQAWPWRDWVIHALNRNQPFDQFTIEQIAGDLLPDATLEQKVATGFLRNHPVTNETGIIDEEYRVEYVADRTETTATVWLGLTLGCARCHDHKFDPFSQRDYYQLFAFFNNGPETGLVSADDPPPLLDVATNEQRQTLERLTAQRHTADEQLQRHLTTIRDQITAWENSARAELRPPQEDGALHVPFEPQPSSVREVGNVTYEAGLVGNAAVFDAMQHLEGAAEFPLHDDQPWSIGVWLKPTGSLNGVFSKIEPTDRRRGVELLWQKGRIQVNLVHRWGVDALEVATKQAMRGGDWRQVIVSYDGSRQAVGLRVFVDGQPTPLNVVRDRLTGSIQNSEPLRIGRRDTGLGYYGRLDELRILRRAVAPDEARRWFWSDRLNGILATEPQKRQAGQSATLLECFVERHADATTRRLYAATVATREVEEQFRQQLPKAMVMQDLPQPRPTYVLTRGQYDQRGEVVRAGVPASLSELPADWPRTRLGLARWLVAPGQPLTARVAVNRLWRQCFGEGLIRTANDFGAQGEPPTHADLLDWLAVRFQDDGWDVKGVLRRIVTSATYRQSSAATPSLLTLDPENRWLARGPRFRMSAEMIRDQALAASGLLVERVGGPSVKPYQPPGLWEAVSYDGELSYEADQGEGLWRRSVYTYRKRQSPPPSLLVFDGPTRETCVVARARTNTPLQALVLLNDVTYLEAARNLATLVLLEPGDDDAQLREAFRRVVSRLPDDEELAQQRQLLARQRAHFQRHPDAARQLIAMGQSPLERRIDPVELAAWSVAVQAILLLDETITRR